MSNEQLKEAYSYLKASPIFTMSLSAKELFHSNFISYLAIEHTEFFNNILDKLGLEPFIKEGETLTNRSCNSDKPLIRVYRENSHTDISFEEVTFKGPSEDGAFNKDSSDYDSNNNYKRKKIRLIIENKVKSVPYREQLEKYVRDNKSYFDTESEQPTQLLLLTFIKPEVRLDEQISFTQKMKKGKSKIEEKKEIKWVVKTYKDFADAYADALNNYDCQNPYTKSILEDYLKSIRSLWTYVMAFNNDLANKTVGEYLPYCKDEINDLRLSDLTAKLKYSQLTQMIKCKLEDKITGINYKPKDIITFEKKEQTQGKIFLEATYAQAGPLSGAIITFDKAHKYIVQIQNDSYSRGIINEDYRPKMQAAKKKKQNKTPLQEKEWKDFFNSYDKVISDYLAFGKTKDWYKETCELNSMNNGLFAEKTKNKQFWSFDAMLYGNWKIKEDTLISKLAEYFATEIFNIWSEWRKANPKVQLNP